MTTTEEITEIHDGDAPVPNDELEAAAAEAAEGKPLSHRMAWAIARRIFKGDAANLKKVQSLADALQSGGLDATALENAAELTAAASEKSIVQKTLAAVGTKGARTLVKMEVFQDAGEEWEALSAEEQFDICKQALEGRSLIGPVFKLMKEAFLVAKDSMGSSVSLSSLNPKTQAAFALSGVWEVMPETIQMLHAYSAGERTDDKNLLAKGAGLAGTFGVPGGGTVSKLLKADNIIEANAFAILAQMRENLEADRAAGLFHKKEVAAAQWYPNAPAADA